MKNILLLLCFPLFSYSQVGFKLGVSAGVLYSYRELKIQDNSSIANGSIAKSFFNNVKKQRDDNEKADFGYLYSLNGILSINKWQLETGVEYTSSGYKINVGYILFGDRIGVPISQYKGTADIYYIFTNFRVPIILGYAFNLSSKHRIIPQLGVLNNFSHQAQGKIVNQYDDGYKEEINLNLKDALAYGNAIKDYSISALCGFTYMYEIKKIDLAVTCLFNRSLTPTIDGTIFSEYEYFSAVKIGAFYTLH